MQYKFRKFFDLFKSSDDMVNRPYWSMHDLRRTFSKHIKLIGYTASEVLLESNRNDNLVTVKHYFGG